jgi:GNAT superfamily N-acetyltransferase
MFLHMKAKKAPSYYLQAVKKVPVEDIIAIFSSAGWWHESVQNRKDIPLLIRKSLVFAVAKSSRGKIIGVGRVISDGVDAYIQGVAVLPAYQKKGIGLALIGFLTQECQKRQIGWIGIVAEPGTHTFYRKAGYRSQKGFQLMLYKE